MKRISLLIAASALVACSQSGPESTGLAGSSLGGLMSLYAAYAHPETFGRLGALSPSIWWKDRELLAYAAAQPKPPATLPIRIR
mgnify:CR=1 FL=1